MAMWLSVCPVGGVRKAVGLCAGLNQCSPHLEADVSRRTTSASAECEVVYEFANANLQFRRFELALTRAMREAVASAYPSRDPVLRLNGQGFGLSLI
jgi:hypothetical protein